MALETAIWLSVIDSAPDEREVRAFWNSKENCVLDAVSDADRLCLGDSRAGEQPSPGGGGRVFDLLFLIGTTPNYELPMITNQLIEKIVEAFDAGPGDELRTVTRSELITFLENRRGHFVAPDQGPSTTSPTTT